VLARVFAEELNILIHLFRDLPVIVAAGKVPPPVTEWSQLATTFLEHYVGWEVAGGFRILTQGIERLNSPVVDDADALLMAYMTLGLAYLEEVEERVPDYAELSG
jgi:hypothetical protein